MGVVLRVWRTEQVNPFQNLLLGEKKQKTKNLSPPGKTYVFLFKDNKKVLYDYKKVTFESSFW